MRRKKPSQYNVGGFRFQIAQASTNDRLVLEDMSTNQIALMIELELLSGDLDEFSSLDVWIQDENNTRSDPKLVATGLGRPTAVWGFAVDKKSRSFVLHFPGGDTLKMSFG